MGRLTTHVLDTAHGRAGAGIQVELYAADVGRRLVRTVTTNRDGRTDAALAEGDELEAGAWELVFHVGEYFRRAGVALPDPPFLDQVVIRVGIASPEAHYHVPLLVSPWGYTTYRGT